MHEAVFAVVMRRTDKRPARRHGHGHPFSVFNHQRIEKLSARLHAVGKCDMGIDRDGVIPQRRIGRGVVDVGKLRVKFGPQGLVAFSAGHQRLDRVGELCVAE